MATVVLKAVSKVFPGGVRALSRLDLEVADGELLVVVGPSGCGKSTLLRIVAGLEEVSEGEVWLGGRLVNDIPPQRRNVAMVFQDYALYPFFTVEQNLEFPLRMRGLARAERRQRVLAVARMLDIEGLLPRYPRELSGGQRQRVAMGRALVREPAVSLFDEPLSNLDAKLRVSVRAEIAAIQERTRTTMIYVTHDQTEAMTLGHRVAVLHQGCLQQVAPPREVYTNPANAFVAGFIGNPPMNLFSARLENRDGQPCLRVGTLMFPVHSKRLEKLRGNATAEVTAGVRAEAVEWSAAMTPGFVAATIEHVEELGHEALLYARLREAPQLRWIVRVRSMPPVKKGAVAFFRVAPDQWYVFSDPLPDLQPSRDRAQHSNADQ